MICRKLGFFNPCFLYVYSSVTFWIKPHIPPSYSANVKWDGNIAELEFPVPIWSAFDDGYLMSNVMNGP